MLASAWTKHLYMATPSVTKLIYDCCPGVLHPYLDRVCASDVGTRLARGTFWSVAGAVISHGLMLIALVFVARMLGKTGFGELGMIRSTVGMFGVLAGFGLGVTATKHVAEFRRRDPQRAGRIIGLSWLVALIAGGLMAAAVLVLAPWLATNTIGAPHLASALRIGALILLINALNGAQSGALSGFEAFRSIAHVNVWVGVVSLPVLVAGTWLAGLEGAVWALVINLGVHWLLNHLALRREAMRHQIPLMIRASGRELAVLWTFSMPAMLSGIMAGPILWACKSILANRPGGYNALGSIIAAEGWRAISLFLCAMVAQANLPIMAHLYGEGRIRQFKQALSAQFCLNGTIAGLGAACVTILSKPIMASYGPEFQEDYPVLILVILSTVPMQLTAVVGAANRCMNKVWWNVILNGLWAVVFLLATLAFVDYGALGLAGATLLSYSLQFAVAALYLAVIFHRRLQVEPCEP